MACKVSFEADDPIELARLIVGVTIAGNDEDHGTVIRHIHARLKTLEDTQRELETARDTHTETLQQLTDLILDQKPAKTTKKTKIPRKHAPRCRCAKCTALSS